MTNTLKSKLIEFGWNSAVSYKADGNMAYSHGNFSEEEISKNINKFLKSHKISDRKKVALIPQHLNGVVEVEDKSSQVFEHLTFNKEHKCHYVNADAFISNNTDYLACLKPADCAAVLLVSKDTEWYGFVHVGIVNLLYKTLSRTLSELSTKSTGWTAFVFRHIQKKSYVHESPDLYNVLHANELNSITSKVDEKYYFDLTKGISNELNSNGVENIFVDNDDNFELAINNESFSNRAYKLGKQKEDGRILVCAWKVNN